MASAQRELVAATADYDTTNRKLKELVDRAPEKGFKAKADAISGDMITKGDELGLGLLLVKAVTTGAEVCKTWVQEIRDELQQ